MVILRNKFRFKVGDVVKVENVWVGKIIRIEDCNYRANHINEKGYSQCVGHCPENNGCPGRIEIDNDNGNNTLCHGCGNDYWVEMIQANMGRKSKGKTY